MSKLPDINYALMAQLSYFHWNKMDDERKIKEQSIKQILLTDMILSQIKTDFYNDPSHYPSTEMISKKQGTLPEYTYHEEDRRIFLVYSLDKTRNRTPKFEKILEGWQYLDCATGEMIEKRFFGENTLKEYKDSGFFGVAFQRREDIIIAYRGTEIEEITEMIKDGITDLNIYFKQTDIQQIEAVLFYEYIKSKYGLEKNIHITGHSLAGALAQYVHFYAKCNEDKVITVTWNGLGSSGSAITSLEYSLTEKIVYLSDNTLMFREKQIETQKLFKEKLDSLDKDIKIQERLSKFYSLKVMELLKKRNEIKDDKDLFNYFMNEDLVGGYFDGDWLGQKQSVDILKENIQNILNRIVENTKELKNKELSSHLENILDNFDKLGKDITYPILNLFDGETLSKNLEDDLEELRRLFQKMIPLFEKLPSALAFHNINNFLAFMKDDGNIELQEMRKEFRCNALKTIVKLKRDNDYKFLKGIDRNTKRDKILEIENKDIGKQISTPANRLIIGNVFTPFSLTQTDILFKNTFKNKKFSSKDMNIVNNSLEGVYNGEVILGEYNNLKELGGIQGQSPLIIKIYPVSLGEEKNRIEVNEYPIQFKKEEKVYSKD